MNLYSIVSRIKNKRVLQLMENIVNILYTMLFLFLRPQIRNKLVRKKYYFSVCAIFKNEAAILREWILYYKVIGTDHIYLYNNNSDDDYISILQPFIDEGYVTLIDWPQKHAQMEAYQDCYARVRTETEWLAFFDMDEFLCPLKETNIKDFMRKYEGYPGLLVYWLLFGTNGQLEPIPNKLICEQYTCSWPYLDGTGKIIISTCDSFEPTHFYNHFMYFRLKDLFNIKIPVITEHKHFCLFPQIYCAPKNNSIQLNHYFSRSWKDYLYKMSKDSVAKAENEAVRKKMDFFYLHEFQNSVVNKSIYRYLIKLKLLYYHLENPLDR